MDTKKAGMHPTKVEEEIKYLRLHIEQITKENVALKKLFEDQVESSKQTKRMLSIASIFFGTMRISSAEHPVKNISYR